jgi:hypothetical protein
MHGQNDTHFLPVKRFWPGTIPATQVNTPLTLASQASALVKWLKPKVDQCLTQRNRGIKGNCVIWINIFSSSVTEDPLLRKPLRGPERYFFLDSHF